MTSQNITASSAADRTVVVSRVLNAPRELVFDVWTSAQHMAQWWGPHGFTNPVCEMDFRVGGTYRVVMHGPKGTEFDQDYPVKGIFLEIVRPEKLVMTDECDDHPADWQEAINPGGKPADLTGIATVTFESLGANKTRLTVSTLFKTKKVRDGFAKTGMVEGWGQSLEKLEALLATLKG